MSGEVFNPADFCGWHDNPEAAKATRKAAGIYSLAHGAPGLIKALPAKDILLYRAWNDVLGAYPDYPAQQIGDCESFGHGHGHDLLQCIELVVGKTAKKEAYRETCTEAAYAAGREAGNMLGGGDGCYGSAMIKGLTTLGMVPRELVGAYAGSRAKQWGRSGMPAEIRKAATEFKLGAGALVTTVDEAAAAIENGYPVSISSNQGFEGRGGFQRDSSGFCYAGGSWPHCMFLCGYITSDGRPSFVIAQSWGNKQPGGPQPFDLPAFCFRAESATVARILAQEDSYAMSKAARFVKRPLPATWRNSGWAA